MDKKDNLLNIDYLKRSITTNNKINPTPYRWSHGASDEHMGDGIMVYALIQYMCFKNCVCIGSGGGFIPRIMTQARIDLYNQGMFEGNKDFNWGDIGTTYLVDPCNNVGGGSDVSDKNNFFNKTFVPRFIKSTSQEAYYNFFVRHEIKIDLLFLDGDHSYEGLKSDFELYTTLLNDKGVVIVHDTDKSYFDSLLISEDAKKDYHNTDGVYKFLNELKESNKWNVLPLHNFVEYSSKPSSTGITLINKK